ncbi:MAG TPA: 2-phospho-L-lactate transferase [Desertimonas sp.]|nr:2-phospho-L-lactate transferase [Desertimonas sp.]
MMDSPASVSDDVAVLCGGVGAARFLTGAVQVRPAASITAVVNTADDTVINGLAISPDLDTIVYTLAGAIDPQRGWGLRGETWTAIEALQRYVAVRPDTSTAAVTWFRLGDRDLATHLYRTARRGEGATLTEITAEIAAAWDVGVRVLPMTDGDVSTHLILADGSDLPFQDYFVRLHHDVEVAAVNIETSGSEPTAAAIRAIADAEIVVVAPSNPLVSIQPLRALPGIDESLSRRRDSVVAVSPIIGGRALKGPADRLLRELGHEPSVVGIARIYAPIAAALVIDPVDAELAGAVEAAGMRPVVAPSVMSTPPAAAQLARATLDAAVSR